MSSRTKDKNQNIQVFVRLRPLNNREREIKSLGVVEVSGSREIVVKQSLDSKHSKKFTFDRAFGPNSKQVDVYQEVVSPLIDEVLAGYNCTVFAYGQTGTGKTHTMVGENSGDADIPWQNDPMAGIIPRSLSQLFDELRITNSEYTVRVSYLELYNEELFDLLSPSEDNSKLRIYEDVTRKGSNIVNGLEEVTVYNKNEVYRIMEKGQEKRRIASTLMNAQSSRSHTVFTIVVHMKENSPDGEELMKVGKLNLVDLAGSENISKAGTDNPSRKERARECVNINQSLLTLGRVITALVERHPHIPYRESKLTRLLQESLGGRTKTSIIATISPGHKDVEETLSTLEYANRAKNIQNKPEVNQKITKHAVLKEYSEEIDRLKRDLVATREKNGVYLANETYTEMTVKIEEQEKEIQDKILYIKVVKEEKDKMEAVFAELSNSLREKEKQLEKTGHDLFQTRGQLHNTQKKLEETNFKSEEHQHVISKQVETEQKLSKQAKDLLNVAEVTTTDIQYLHNTVEKKKALENHNLQNVKAFGDKAKSHRVVIKDHLSDFTASHVESLQSLQNILDSHHSSQTVSQNASKQLIELIASKVREASVEMQTKKDTEIGNFENFCKNKFDELHRNVAEDSAAVHENLNNILKLVENLDRIRQSDYTNFENLKRQIVNWNQNSMQKVVHLQSKQEEFISDMMDRFSKLKDSHSSREEKHNQQSSHLRQTRQQYQQELNEDIINLKNKFLEHIAELEKKHMDHGNSVQLLERDLLKQSEQTGSEILETMSLNVTELSNKGKEMTETVATIVEKDESFYTEINNVIKLYDYNLQSEENAHKEIKDSTKDVYTSSVLAWKKHSAIESAVHETIELKQREVIEALHKSNDDILQNSNEELLKCSNSMSDTISMMNEHLNEDKIHIKKLNESVETHRAEMEDNLHFNDVIESVFLNEEYKTYSPTGKTPLRKSYDYSRDLTATSPHERIRQNYRNIRNANKTRCSPQVIELDQTIEEDTKEASSPNSNETSAITDTSSQSPIFVEPKLPVPLNRIPSIKIDRSCSENDIYNLTDDEQSKENLNRSNQDKKEFTSKLKQPSSLKKVLSVKN